MPVRALPALAIAVAVLAFPAGTSAKFTCEQRGARPDGIVIRGLPAEPIAGRTYELTVTLPTAGAVNASPYLGAQYCGDRRPRGRLAGAGGRFQRVESGEPGLFALRLRIPEPGRWALSFMDLGGTFHDFGLRAVRHATGAEPRDRVSGKRLGGVSAEPAGSERASVWLAVALGVLAAAAGLALAGRTKRGKGA
jgi:hypothetical protein